MSAAFQGLISTLQEYDCLRVESISEDWSNQYWRIGMNTLMWLSLSVPGELLFSARSVADVLVRGLASNDQCVITDAVFVISNIVDESIGACVFDGTKHPELIQGMVAKSGEIGFSARFQMACAALTELSKNDDFSSMLLRDGLSSTIETFIRSWPFDPNSDLHRSARAAGNKLVNLLNRKQESARLVQQHKQTIADSTELQTRLESRAQLDHVKDSLITAQQEKIVGLEDEVARLLEQLTTEKQKTKKALALALEQSAINLERTRLL
jgi:hypothetical protein